MSSDIPASDREPNTPDESPPTGEPDRASLVAELETLRAEADRLRDSYVRARRNQYRRTALGFAVLGALATAGGVLFPTTRTVLFALGGTGLFAALLTWFVTPERFVAAGVGDAVYDSLATNHERLSRQLGLSDERVYVPTGEATTGVRLYVPQEAGTEIPEADSLESLFVVTAKESTRGVSLQPTGETLFGEFEAALSGPLATAPGDIFAQVREALVEQFEVVGGLEGDLDPAGGRLTLDVVDSSFGELPRFDHPVASTVAVALARGLDRPVRLELAGDDGEAIATLRWKTDQAGDDAEPDEGADAVAEDSASGE